MRTTPLRVALALVAFITSLVLAVIVLVAQPADDWRLLVVSVICAASGGAFLALPA